MGITRSTQRDMPRHANTDGVGAKGGGIDAIIAVRTFGDARFCTEVTVRAFDTQFIQAVVIGCTGTAELVTAWAQAIARSGRIGVSR